MTVVAASPHVSHSAWLFVQAKLLCNGELERSTGNLLYHIATRYKGPEGRTSLLVNYVCAKKLTCEPQATGEMRVDVHTYMYTVWSYINLMNAGHCGQNFMSCVSTCQLCHVVSRVSNNVHRLVVIEYAHCTCKLEAVSII